MIRDAVAYFYYRCYQLYKGSMRSDGPLSLLIGLNISVPVNMMIRITTSYGDGVIPLLIAADGVIVIISVIVTALVVVRYRKSLDKKMERFKQETTSSRKKNGKLIILYIISSLLAFFMSMLL